MQGQTWKPQLKDRECDNVLHDQGYSTPQGAVIDEHGGSGGTKNLTLRHKPNKKLAYSLFFGLDDGGDMFFRNVVDFQRTTRRYVPEDRN
jgi:hypothetical protein